MTQILHGQAPARGRTAVPVSIDLGHVDPDALEAKLHRLQDQIRSYGRLAIAFSGGVDSTLLVKVDAGRPGRGCAGHDRAVADPHRGRPA
jgi:hypothetical protein